MKFTIEELAAAFRYDPETGDIIRIKAAKGHPAGEVSKYITKSGYRSVGYKKVQIMCHRLAWALHYGAWPEHYIDHINGIRSDNRLCNIRAATAYGNARNHATHRAGKIWGAQKHSTGRWQASFRHKGKSHYVGLFMTAEEASAACLGYIKGLGLESEMELESKYF